MSINIQQHTVFDGYGLNSDDDIRLMDEHSAVSNRNILIGEDGSNGTITNMKGTDHIVVTTDYPDYVGSCFDADTRCAYWFGYDSVTKYCGLFKMNVDTNVTTKIFEDTGEYFGIDPAHKMKDVKYLNGRIYFNPQTSEPKVIDVDMAYYYTTYNAWSNSTTYQVGSKVRFCGGVFNCVTLASAGESPATQPIKWERLYDCYDNANNQFSYAFNVIRKPPSAIPIATFESDTTISSNNLRGKIFRFAYRYRYYDDTYSVFSSFSNLSLPTYEEAYDGEVINDITYNNCLSVSVASGDAAIVKEIDIIYQEINGDWKKITTTDRTKQTTLPDLFTTVKFYNNATYEAVDNSLVDRIYDAVPRTAACQELINKNVLLYAGVKEGFDNLDKNDMYVTLTPVLEEIVVTPIVGTLRRDNIASGDEYTAKEWDAIEKCYKYYDIIKIGTWYSGSGIVAGDYFTFTVSGYETVLVFGGSMLATEQSFRAAIANAINFPPGWVEYRTVGGYYELWIGSRTIQPNITVSKFYLASTTTLQTKKPGFKTGATQPFCIYYYDASLRRGDAQVCDDLSVYIPTLAETVPQVQTNNWKYNINWAIEHLPPSWAKYWRFGFAGNGLCSYFVQYIVSATSSSDASFNNRATIDITPLQTIKTTTTTNWNQFSNSVIDPYVWEEGDRVRFITKSLSGGITYFSNYSGTVPGTVLMHCAEAYSIGTGSVITIDSGAYAGTYTITEINSLEFYFTATYTTSYATWWRCPSGYMQQAIYDYEITSYDATTNKLILQHGITLPVSGPNSLVEIYKPTKTNEKTIYYEYGPIYPTITDTLGVLVHGGSTTDQSTDTQTDATGTFVGGDVYHILRTPDKPFNETAGYTDKGIIHESQWYSDFYLSDDWGAGRIGYENNIGEQTLNIIRYSNVYLQNTRLNGLSTFESLNYIDVNDVYGDIQRIVENGETLKVYQATKTSSVWIGKREIIDTTGQTTMASADKVLGSINYSFTKYGTVNPESITQNHRFIYGFDIYNATVWRDSPNGLFPISGRFESVDGEGNYKMETYFKAKSKALLTSGLQYVSIQTVWDEEYKLLYVLFSDTHTPANNDVVVFHEPSNRWITFCDLKVYNGTTYDAPVWAQSLDLGWISFGKNNAGYSVWRHNSNVAANRCTFYGTKQNCEVGVVANKNGGVAKTFDTICLYSDGQWSLTITIPANLNHPYGMYSILPTAKFIKREGKLMSEFMRNGKTNSSTASTLDYLNGELLRGYAADIRLTNTSTSKVSMLMVDVGMTKSDV